MQFKYLFNGKVWLASNKLLAQSFKVVYKHEKMKAGEIIFTWNEQYMKTWNFLLCHKKIIFFDRSVIIDKNMPIKMSLMQESKKTKSWQDIERPSTPRINANYSLRIAGIWTKNSSGDLAEGYRSTNRCKCNLTSDSWTGRGNSSIFGVFSKTYNFVKNWSIYDVIYNFLEK